MELSDADTELKASSSNVWAAVGSFVSNSRKSSKHSSRPGICWFLLRKAMWSSSSLSERSLGAGSGRIDRPDCSLCLTSAVIRITAFRTSGSALLLPMKAPYAPRMTLIAKPTKGPWITSCSGKEPKASFTNFFAALGVCFFELLDKLQAFVNPFNHKGCTKLFQPVWHPWQGLNPKAN